MSERYRQLSVDRKRRYIPGSPIILEAQALLKDNVTNEVMAQLKFKNVSRKTIKAVTVSIECLDVMGNEVQWVDSFQYLDLDIPRGWEFGQNIAVPLPDETTRSFAVTDVIVIFSDDSVWTPEDAMWVEIPEKRPLAEELDCLLGQYRRDVTEKAKWCPREYEDLWLCACGYENHDDEDECHKCATSKESVFVGLDAGMLQKHKEEYEKELADKRAAEEAKKQAKKDERKAWLGKHKKKMLLIAALLIVACVAFGAAWYMLLPSNAFAVFSDDDMSLTFYKSKLVPKEGETYEGKTVTTLYEGIEEVEYSSDNEPEWVTDETCSKVVTVIVKDRVAPKSCAFWFAHMQNCESADVRNLDTGGCNDSSNLFLGCNKLTVIDVSSFDTSNIEDFSDMFANCSRVVTLDLRQFDTSRGRVFSGMFKGCSSLQNLDVSSFRTSGGTDFSSMFDGCKSLPNLDVAHFETSSCTRFSSMFKGCKSLKSLDVSGFDTSKGKSFDGMFSGCSGLSELQVSNFNTSNAEYFGGVYSDGMFQGCTSLALLNGAQNWDTSKVGNFRAMFMSCEALVLDCSNWNTSGIEDAEDYGRFNTDAPGVIAPAAFAAQTDISMDTQSAGTGSSGYGGWGRPGTGVYGGGKLYGTS